MAAVAAESGSAGAATVAEGVSCSDGIAEPCFLGRPGPPFLTRGAALSAPRSTRSRRRRPSESGGGAGQGAAPVSPSAASGASASALSSKNVLIFPFSCRFEIGVSSRLIMSVCVNQSCTTVFHVLLSEVTNPTIGVYGTP